MPIRSESSAGNIHRTVSNLTGVIYGALCFNTTFRAQNRLSLLLDTTVYRCAARQWHGAFDYFVVGFVHLRGFEEGDEAFEFVG